MWTKSQKRCLFALVSTLLLVSALFVWPLAAFAAEEAVKTEASWVWQILANTSVQAAIWSIVAFILTSAIAIAQKFLDARAGVKTAAVARQIFNWCLYAAEEVYTQFVRELKADEGGKLTEEQKKKAMNQAVELAWGKIKADGLDKAGSLAKEMLPVLIEQAINFLKGSSKASKEGAMLEIITPFSSSSL